MGRPPAGKGLEGQPEKTSQYPKLTVSIHPYTRATLEALTTIERKSARAVVDEAIGLYLQKMAPDDRRMVEAIAKKVHKKD